MLSLFAPKRKDEPCAEIQLSKDCLNRPSLKDSEIGRVIGVGYSGKAFAICGPSGCNRVVKIIELDGAEDEEKFARECAAVTVADKYDLGPGAIDHWVCTGKGFLLTERWDSSVKEALHMGIVADHTLVDAMIDRLWNLWQKEHMWHTEALSADNVFVKIRKGRIVKMTIGDWGDISVFGNYVEPFWDDVVELHPPDTKGQFAEMFVKSMYNVSTIK